MLQKLLQCPKHALVYGPRFTCRFVLLLPSWSHILGSTMRHILLMTLFEGVLL